MKMDFCDKYSQQPKAKKWQDQITPPKKLQMTSVDSPAVYCLLALKMYLLYKRRRLYFLMVTTTELLLPTYPSEFDSKLLCIHVNH